MKDEQPKHAEDLSIARRHYSSVGHNEVLAYDSSAHSRKGRIVCVDDEIVGTQIRGKILEREGYLVAIYHNPLAVLRCDFSSFDLGILDFEMPGLNGRELLLRMRRLGARFPMILHSGYAESLSSADCGLFARCIDKTRPIQYLLDSMATLLDANHIPDCSA